jgi:phosphatidylserine/phosphatidylglycerophosphate/cardiolipin synthase-like enzyme
MYHLTDPEVVKALIDAAKRPATDVRVILDRRSLETNAKRKLIFEALLKGGVKVRKSSPAFSITHAKSMIINQDLAYITAINLTTKADVTRDFGIVTTEPHIIRDMITVFDSDYANSASANATTPHVSEPRLLWSPINAQAKLVGLILSATPKSDVVATVENLNDPEIQKAFVAISARGARVRLIVPECDRNKDPVYNYRYLADFAERGIEVRVMPYPESPSEPYMHSKMISVDESQTYIGSVNFSTHSTLQSRELGIIFSDPEPIRRIRSIFEDDWRLAHAPSTPPPNFCPRVPD